MTTQTASSFGQLTRRGLLAAGAATGAGLVVSAPSYAAESVAAPGGKSPFQLGVASGDPAPDGFVLWTRLAPEPLAPDGRGGMSNAAVPVRWEVAADEQFRQLVATGVELAVPEWAHSVHVEVHGLRPHMDYFYRFRASGVESPAGHTRTTPAADQSPDSFVFALASCQAWTGGRFAAYRTMLEEDLDLVVHVGDYIYEQGGTETLADFRLLHARHKTSPDLQAAHAAFPFVVTFDDHEIENNWAGARSQPDGEESNERFLELRTAAFRAYYEHMPLRKNQSPKGSGIALYRRLAYGNLVEFNVLDTRQYRDYQLHPGFPSAPLDPRSADPERQFMGAAQEKWLFDGMSRSNARWNVLAQQTIMAQFDYDTGSGIAVNHDQWDGYIGSRDRFLDFLAAQQPSNPVVLTGDWHSSWVCDIKADFADPASATLASEFVGTSISSGCGWEPQLRAAVGVNPHVKFLDGLRRGFVRNEVTADQWRADYRVVSAAADPTGPATTLTSWVVEDGNPGPQPA